jgi:hypothetical protein
VSGPAPTAERPHPPGPGATWQEWWSLDFTRDDGFGGFLRVARYPNARLAWFWAYVVTPDGGGPIVVRDHDVTLPRNDTLELRADGLWADNTCETPFEHWTYGLEAFGVRLDDPADALTGEIGERLPVGWDLEWEVLAPPYTEAHAGVTGYEQAGIVHGEVLLARERIEFDGHGTRAHGWGHDVWRAGDHHAAFQHGTEFAMAVTPRGGYRWRGGHGLHRFEHVEIETHTGAFGVPVASRYVLDHATQVDADVLAVAPVPLEGDAEHAAFVARALCRFTVDDGTTATGWAEWPLDRGS